MTNQKRLEIVKRAVTNRASSTVDQFQSDIYILNNAGIINKRHETVIVLI